VAKLGASILNSDHENNIQENLLISEPGEFRNNYIRVCIITTQLQKNHWILPTLIKTSCGARHNKPRPCCHLANDTDLSTPVIWAMAGDNKQIDLWPADPFTRIDPKLNQVVPWSLHTFPENFMQIGPAVFSYEMLLTKKQRKKEIAYRGRGKNSFFVIIKITRNA